MADADLRVEWLEPPGAGAGSFKPLSARGVRVSVALADASGMPVLVLGLKPKEARDTPAASSMQQQGLKRRGIAQIELPLLRLRCFAGMLSQGRLTLRLEPEQRPRGARGAQVMLSGGDPEALAALARAAEAAARGERAAPAQPRPPLAPLAPLNGAKRPLGVSPGKPAQPSRRGEGEGASAPEPQLPLSAAQLRAVELVAARRNVFITGAAGTGKSHVLRAALERAPCARGATFLTAPTGLAAAELGPGGMTLNAFAGVGRAEGTVEQLIARVKGSKAAVARWRACSRLVVDEVSMLDAELLDALDEVARAVRGRDSACFGGIQLILCGDFFQLPPVRRGGDSADGDADAAATHCYAFGARAWAEAKLSTVELTQPFRQSDDPAFFRLLNTIRRGQLDAAAEATLRRCEAAAPATVQPAGGPAIVPTRLHTHRADVERENVLALAELPGEAESFAAEDSGGGGAGDAAQRLSAAGCRARATLRLKVGAQVMLLRAVAPRAGLVNGARGVVVAFTQDAARLPVVRFACGVTTPVCRVRFAAAGCARLQLPLELAWALSVHKAQGMSLDAVEVSLARAFEAGQAYVALSRARSLAGLRVARGGVTRDAVRAHPAVIAFYDRPRDDDGEEDKKPQRKAGASLR